MWRQGFQRKHGEPRQITVAQKLQIIQTVDENPNMKRIDIARMMKIPSSTLNRILAKRKILKSACNDGNSSSRKQIQAFSNGETIQLGEKVRSSALSVHEIVFTSINII
ncbi:Major centromere autoantigen B [Trichinella papuae]|uniref:Major centromere autoantigen B n=1 Tax=Trichinella papuae TaxID=268474 RepID=A0A0V1M2F1_9BILA|nr:Major centromere autoantigen B [Trichinella papuae]